MRIERIKPGKPTQKCKFCGTKWDLTKTDKGDGPKGPKKDNNRNGGGGGGNKAKEVSDKDFADLQFMEQLDALASKLPKYAGMVESIKAAVKPPPDKPTTTSGHQSDFQRASAKSNAIQKKLEKSVAAEKRLAKDMAEAKERSATLVQELFDANAEVADVAQRVRNSIIPEQPMDNKVLDLSKLGGPEALDITFGDAFEGVEGVVVTDNDKAEFECLQKKVANEVKEIFKKAFAPVWEAVAKGKQEVQEHVKKKRKLEEDEKKQNGGSPTAAAAGTGPAAAATGAAPPAGSPPAPAASSAPPAPAAPPATGTPEPDGDEDTKADIEARLEQERIRRTTPNTLRG